MAPLHRVCIAKSSFSLAVTEQNFLSWLQAQENFTHLIESRQGNLYVKYVSIFFVSKYLFSSHRWNINNGCSFPSRQIRVQLRTVFSKSNASSSDLSASAEAFKLFFKWSILGLCMESQQNQFAKIYTSWPRWLFIVSAYICFIHNWTAIDLYNEAITYQVIASPKVAFLCVGFGVGKRDHK